MTAGEAAGEASGRRPRYGAWPERPHRDGMIRAAPLGGAALAARKHFADTPAL